MPDGLTEESNDVWMERSFPEYCVFSKFHKGKLINIFTVNLAYGLMDGTYDGHTDRQMEFQAESCFC